MPEPEGETRSFEHFLSGCLTAEDVKGRNGKGQKCEDDHASLAQEVRDQAANDSAKDTF